MKTYEYTCRICGKQGAMTTSYGVPDTCVDCETKDLKEKNTIKEINLLCKKAFNNACAKGWWDTERTDIELIALMHSELSEALEALRNNEPRYWIDKENGGKPEGVIAELADTVIRIFDFCGFHGADLGQAVIDKMAYNKTRPYKHGGKSA